MGLGAPDFILVGAARSGSTTMFQWLDGHPGIFMCRPKEPGFFVNGFGVNDAADYERLFARRRGRLAGEATSMYLASPESPQRIRTELGDVPILILLRDPVAHAFSMHTWMHQNGLEPEGNFEEALLLEPGRIADPSPLAPFRQCLCDYRYFTSGLYSGQVGAYQERFSSVKVLLMEDLHTDPQGSFDQVCAFLGLAPAPIRHAGPTNVGRRPRWPGLQLAIRRRILQVEEGTRPWDRAATVALWRGIKLNIRLGEVPRIRPDTAAELRTRYGDDIVRTAALIDRDLSHWVAGTRPS